MALRMVALVRAKDGSWFARKGIPEDVRDPYARRFGVRREAHLRLPRDTPHHEAKTRCAEWIADVETRIATLRAESNGEGQPLTKLNAIALAGRWYTWFVGQHENDPGSAKRWKEMSDHLVWDVIYPEAPESYHENPKADPHWEWQKEPEVREAVRPQVAELARVATFLASEGRALNATAYALFVDAVSDNLLPAITLLERRANGDYSPDDTPDSFPALTDGPTRGNGVSCWELFEAFVTAKKPKPNTVSRWRAVFLEMQRQFAEVGADGITEDAARTWVHGLINEDLLAQPPDVTVGGDAEDGAHGHRLEPGPGPQGLRHGTPLGAELGVPGGHLEGGGEHAVDGRAPEELRHLRPAGEMPSPRVGRPLEARHPAVGRRPLDLGQRGVHRCAPFEGGALAPALALLGHHPDEEQRPGPVHAGGGADVVTEGDVDADELHPGQLHGDEAPTPSP